MHFFITGHTGFKGSWLVLLLKELGHEVSGYSLEPAPGGLFSDAALGADLKNHFIGDVRDLSSLKNAIDLSRPDVAIHMAAQPLVLRSYEDPIETYSTNVDGTRNFLQATTDANQPPVMIVITTDKVYRDSNKGSYVESDPLGGHDPYSASKAMADIMTQSWALANPDLRIHIARAGNVIGAFDVSENRLIPDSIRAMLSQSPIEVRHPSAVRPWQHVLDCLYGYLLLSYKASESPAPPTVLNFGPDPENILSVRDILKKLKQMRQGFDYQVTELDEALKETQLLTLDSSLAFQTLSWKNRVGIDLALEWSIAGLALSSPRDVAISQVRSFLASVEA